MQKSYSSKGTTEKIKKMSSHRMGESINTTQILKCCINNSQSSMISLKSLMKI